MRSSYYDIAVSIALKFMKEALFDWLKHNLFKNVSNWVTFFWQTQIQTIKYGLNDTKRIKEKQVTLTLYSFTPSDTNFQTNLNYQVILAKFLSQKIYSLETFLC